MVGNLSGGALSEILAQKPWRPGTFVQPPYTVATDLQIIRAAGNAGHYPMRLGVAKAKSSWTSQLRRMTDVVYL